MSTGEYQRSKPVKFIKIRIGNVPGLNNKDKAEMSVLPVGGNDLFVLSASIVHEWKKDTETESVARAVRGHVKIDHSAPKASFGASCQARSLLHISPLNNATSCLPWTHTPGKNKPLSQQKQLLS